LRKGKGFEYKEISRSSPNNGVCIFNNREETPVMLDTKKVGSVMIVGGGVTGMQAALDLADSGYYVYLVEKSGAIGGAMAQLDKTFPTNDCSM
jgi:heterodisulfide reductase subunit A